MQTKKFIYENKERQVLVIEENDQDIYGYDLDLWPEESLKLLKTTFRHFKKDKIKTKEIFNIATGKEKKFEI